MLLMTANSITHVVPRYCLKQEYNRSEIARAGEGGGVLVGGSV